MGDQNMGVGLSQDLNPWFSQLGNVTNAVRLGTTKVTTSLRVLKNHIQMK